MQTNWLENRAGRIIINGYNLSLQAKASNNQDALLLSLDGSARLETKLVIVNQHVDEQKRKSINPAQSAFFDERK